MWLVCSPSPLGRVNLLSPQGFPSSEKSGPWYFNKLLVVPMENPDQRPLNEAFSKPILYAPLDYWVLTTVQEFYIPYLICCCC